ncbi:MAG: adenosylcobinamide-GDP ribazoletransferase [Candidatus Binatia bacterium]
MRSFLTALKFLTAIPWPKQIPTTPEEISRSTLFFPLVGLCLGLILVLLDWLLEPYLASEILSVVLVAALIIMTRAIHLHGLGETFEQLAKGRELIPKAMGDNYLRLIGLLAVLVVIAFKFRTIEVIGEMRSQGLLLAPVLARWAMVVLAYGSESPHERIGGTMVEHVRGWHLLVATVLTLALVVLFAGRSGLWIALWVSFFTLLSRKYLHHRLSGVTWDAFGAVGEMSEALALVLFASLE